MNDYKIKMAAQTADYQRRQREEDASSEVKVDPIRAARAAAFGAAKREIKDGSAIDAEAVIAIVEAAIAPLADAIANLAAAFYRVGTASVATQASASPALSDEEREESKRIRELAYFFERAFNFDECSRFARFHGGAEPTKYLPRPVSYPDATSLIARDLLQRVNPAELMRDLLVERPRRAADIRAAMPYVSDAELAEAVKKDRK